MLLLLTTHLGCKPWMSQAESELKISFLQSGLHGTRKHYMSCKGREPVKLFYPAETPTNHDNDQYGKMSVKTRQVTPTR